MRSYKITYYVHPGDPLKELWVYAWDSLDAEKKAFGRLYPEYPVIVKTEEVRKED